MIIHRTRLETSRYEIEVSKGYTFLDFHVVASKKSLGNE